MPTRKKIEDKQIEIKEEIKEVKKEVKKVKEIKVIAKKVMINLEAKTNYVLFDGSMILKGGKKEFEKDYAMKLLNQTSCFKQA